MRQIAGYRALFFTSLLGLVTGASTLLAADELVYDLATGSVSTFETKIWAKVPVAGEIESVVTSALTVLARDGEFMKIEDAITTTVSGKPGTSLTFRCQLDPEGNLSAFEGVDMTNADHRALAGNTSLALNPLPGGAPAVGMTWQAERPLHLARSPIPGIPEMVRLNATYTLTELRQGQHGREATVTMKVVQSPGQKIEVDATGQIELDLETGRPLFSVMNGTAKIKVLFSTLTAPFRVETKAR